MFFLLFVEDEPPWPEIGDGHANEFLGVPMGNERPGRVMDHAWTMQHGACGHRRIASYVGVCVAVLRSAPLQLEPAQDRGRGCRGFAHHPHPGGRGGGCRVGVVLNRTDTRTHTHTNANTYTHIETHRDLKS